MTVEDVRRNYNQIGVAIMERMYTEDYLSIGGVESTDRLASLAGITEESRVLDVGCGIGGPALHLAETYRCEVTGLDLMEHSVEEAKERAASRGLQELAEFRTGDATAMPFADEAFDVVWGQDAWCHVVDKSALIGESARVLRPGGTIAFTDWLVTGEMSDAERSEVLNAAASSEMATADQYLRLLADNGFADVRLEDISSIFAEQYEQIFRGLAEMENELVETYGRSVFDIVTRINGLVQKAFAKGSIGGSRFIATKAG